VLLGERLEMAKGKVYVIGSSQLILPFRAGGAVLCAAEDRAGVSLALDEVAAQPPGSLVLITEEAASRAPEEVQDFGAPQWVPCFDGHRGQQIIGSPDLVLIINRGNPVA